MSHEFDYDKHVRTLYDAASRRYGFYATTPEELAIWQSNFRRALRKALGLPRMEAYLARHNPTDDLVESADMGDYVREKWYLNVEPTVSLPFWLLRPKVEGKVPLVLTPHGHNHPDIYVGIARNEEEERSIAEGERDIAVQAVKEGYLAIAPTARAFGETAADKERSEGKFNSCRSALVHGLLVGRTPIGERVYDISRLIDWALVRPDVDGERIGITGNSGGGTISVFAPACDERIKVALPGSYFCTFTGSIGTIHHCECNYIPGLLEMGEMHDVAGLIAPRPFCAIAGKEDNIFPLASVKEAFDHLKHVYEVAGVPDRCQLFVGEGGHRYYKAGSWPFIRKWFEKAEALSQ